MNTIPISTSDATLAHVMAKATTKLKPVRNVTTTINAGYHTSKNYKTAKEFVRDMKRIYKHHLIGHYIHDARYKHRHVVLYVFANVECTSTDKPMLGLMSITMQGDDVTFQGSSILISLHSVARIMQRTLHTNDVRKVFDILRARVMFLADKRHFFTDKCNWKIYGRGGVLCGSFDTESGLIIKTWVDQSTDRTGLANSDKLTLEVL